MDVAPDNVSAVLRKVEGSGAEWSSFTVGPTAGDTSVSGVAMVSPVVLPSYVVWVFWCAV